MRTAIRYALAATIGLFLAVTTVQAQSRNILFSARGGGNLTDLYILDPSNGSVLLDLGPTGFSISGLRFDPTTGVLYGSTANRLSAGDLITLNPITGAGTFVGNFGIANHTMADIAFTRNGTLYGWAEPSRDDLHIINKATGAATDVGNAGLSTFGSGLAANSQDVLYFTGNGPSGALRIVDKNTGLTTVVTNMSGAPLPGGSINALAFDSHNVLYAINGGDFGPNSLAHLVIINTTTGVITDLGPTLNSMDALAFLFSNDPEELSAIYQIGFSQTTATALNLQRRMDDIRAGSHGFCDNVTVMPSGKDMGGGKGPSDGKTAVLPTSTSEVMPLAPENKWGLWTSAAGQFIDVNDDAFDGTGYDITSGGLTLGIDYRVCDGFAAGLYGSYMRSDVDFNDQPFGLSGGGLTADSGAIGLYATGWRDGFYLQGGVSGGYNSYDIHRNDVLGFEDGSTDGWQFDIFVAAGYDFHWRCLMFGPIASMQYTDVQINSFTEANSSILALHYPEQEEQSARSTLGLRWSIDWKLGDHIILRTESRAVWKHEFEDTANPIVSRFALAALGSGNLAVFGPDIGRDSALVSSGFSILWNDRISTYAHADSEYGRENYENVSASGGVRVNF